MKVKDKSDPKTASLKNRLLLSFLLSFQKQLSIYPVSRHWSRYYGFRNEPNRQKYHLQSLDFVLNGN